MINNFLDQDLRTLRIAYTLVGRVRESVHFDPIEKKTYRYLDRGLSLDKYKGRQDVFGTFTSIFKLGINPLSNYNTPIGIYCYPVDFLISNYTQEYGSFEVPYPTPRRQVYLTVFSADVDRCLVFKSEDDSLVKQYRNSLSSDDEKYYFYKVQEEIRKINKILSEMIAKNKESDIYNIKKVYQLVQGMFANLVLYKVDPDLVQKIRSQYFWRGIENLTEIPDEIMILGEISHYFQSKSTYDLPLFPYEDRIQRLPEVQALKLESRTAYEKFMRKVLAEDQRVASDQAFVWNFTRHLSEFNPRKWAIMLYSLGFTGAIDYGTKTIHENEPTQAVFFDRSSLKPLEVISNKAKQYDDNDHPSGNRTHRDFSRWTREELGVVTARSRFRDSLLSLTSSVKNFQGNLESSGSIYFQQNVLDNLRKIFMVTGWFRANVPDDPMFLRIKTEMLELLDQIRENYLSQVQPQLRTQVLLNIKALRK